MSSWPRLIVALPLLALAVAVLVGLSAWQLSRDSYKNALEAEREARIAAGPLVPGAPGAALSPEEIDYRRVAVEGSWDHEHTLTIAGRIRFGVRGEEVVVPLIPRNGDAAILVNRGWYPLSERERVLAGLSEKTAASIEGLARYVPGSSARQLAPGVWSRYDARSMGAALPYPVEPWSLIEGGLLEAQPATPPPTLPIQGYLAYRNTVPHLEYAITWFGLAVVLLVTFYFRFRPRRGDG